MTRLFLLRFFESYFRHRWLYLIPIVITIGAAVVYFMTYVPKYTARGILYINGQSLLNTLTAVPNNDTNWWLTPAQATSSEVNELLQTDSFVRAVIKDTKLEAYMAGGQGQVFEVIYAVRKSIWLFPVGNNEVAITASFDDPEVSFQLVHSVINSYIRWNINTRRVDSQVAQDFFVTLIERHGLALEDARQKLRDYYDANPQPVRGERPISQQLEIAHLQNEIDLASSRYQAALQKEEEANLAMTQIDSEVRHTYELMDAPLLPEKPDISRKKMAMEAGIFLGAGVLLSMIGITGGALLDRSFRFPVDIQTRLSLPVLAIIPAPAQEKWYVRFRFAIFARRGKEKGETAKLVPLQPIKDPSKPVNKPSEQSVDVTV